MNYKDAQFIISYGRAKQIPPSSCPEIAFAGRSNVGKSSLLNRLFGRKSLARVSSVPGKTGTVNFYKAGEIHFVDLPGYGYAKVSKQERQRYQELMNGYFGEGRDWLLIVLLMDMRHKPSTLDSEMAQFLIDSLLPFVVVLTKADKLSKKKQEEQIALFRNELPCGEDLTLIPFSSVTGQGLEKLQGILDDVTEEV